MIVAAAGPIGLTITLVYTGIGWWQVGLRPGDVSLGVTDVAPPAAFITAAVLLGVGMVVHTESLKHLPGPYWRAMATYCALMVGASLIAGQLTRTARAGFMTLFMAFATGLYGAYTARSWRQTRRKGLKLSALTVFVVGWFSFVTIVSPYSSQTGEPSPSLLPFGFGPAVRFVRLVANDEALKSDVANVTCALSMGAGPHGRVLRVVRDVDSNPATPGVASLLFVDGQLVTLATDTNCSTLDRAMMWNSRVLFEQAMFERALADAATTNRATTSSTPTSTTAATSSG